jgi:hypothetical protein
VALGCFHCQWAVLSTELCHRLSSESITCKNLCRTLTTDSVRIAASYRNWLSMRIIVETLTAFCFFFGLLHIALATSTGCPKKKKQTTFFDNHKSPQSKRYTKMTAMIWRLCVSSLVAFGAILVWQCQKNSLKTAQKVGSV